MTVQRNSFIRILFFLFISSVCNINLCSQINLSPAEKSWLFRIVQRSPCLKENCDECFNLKHPGGLNLFKLFGGKIDYDALSLFIEHYPDTLAIDWNCLKSKSSGTISELAIKFTIWQLNEELITAITHFNPEIDTTYTFIHKQLLAEILKSETIKNKKHQANNIINTIVHPSYPVQRKIDELNKLKIDVKDQKKLLEKWNNILNSIIFQRSKYYYSLIKGTPDVFELKMMAAGEGSGTSGLLYEYEKHPEDSTKTWYGKAAGLFTYEYSIRKNVLTPKEITTSGIYMPPDKNIAIHSTLWGLNSTTKPIIVFTHNNKSYQLYAPSLLTPDPDLGKGLTQIDRIHQIQEIKVDEPLKKLNEDGGLQSILNKELQLKEEIENKIHEHEQEIDTLRKTVPVNQTKISYHIGMIDTYLTNLTSKENRIADLSRKLTAEYRKIDQARSDIEVMKTFLGKNVQGWSKSDSIYYFNDGVIFDYSTQDLVFPAQKNESTMKVNLLSPSMVISGALKDEIQLFLSMTETTYHSKPKKSEVKKQFNIFYNQDQFETDSTLKEFHEWVNDLNSIKSVDVDFEVDTTYKLPDQPMYEYQTLRQTEIFCKYKGDTLSVTIKSGCDPERTRLSRLEPTLRNKLGIAGYSNDNNKYLAVLRILNTFKALELPEELCEYNFDNILKIITKEELTILSSTND